MDHLYKLLFPLPKDASYKVLALIGQAVSEEKIFEIVDGRFCQRRMYAGARPSYKLTYSKFQNHRPSDSGDEDF